MGINSNLISLGEIVEQLRRLAHSIPKDILFAMVEGRLCSSQCVSDYREH